MQLRHPVVSYVLNAIVCVFVTFIAARAISLFMVNVAMEADGSDAGRALFAMLITYSMKFSIPIAILNALFISPFIALNRDMDSNLITPIFSNLIALGILILSVPFLSMLAGTFTPIEGWTVFFYAPFVIPPLIIGSLFYSYCKVILLKI